MPVNYTCPYCQHKILLQDADIHEAYILFKFLGDRVRHGRTGVQLVSYACPNPTCQELAISVYWHELADIRYEQVFTREALRKRLGMWRLRPESSAKPQPDYIPPQIVEDYYEACRIRDLSPKASATLSRRCLQGMIRHFWDVKDKKNLYEEIEAIKEKVDTATWEAIDTVRGVGNIGAHMEKDVDLIVSVEPGEAQLLLELIETLFDEWYVAKHDREQRMGEIKRLGEEKRAAKCQNTDPAAKDS